MCMPAPVYFVCTCVLALCIPTCVCVYLSMYLCTRIILCVNNLVCVSMVYVCRFRFFHEDVDNASTCTWLYACVCMCAHTNTPRGKSEEASCLVKHGRVLRDHKM